MFSGLMGQQMCLCMCPMQGVKVTRIGQLMAG